MSDFAKYQTAKAETRAAYERYNYAGAALELAQIKERLAEMASQHDPLAALLNEAVSECDRLYAAAHYTVFGRLPNKVMSKISNQPEWSCSQEDSL